MSYDPSGYYQPVNEDGVLGINGECGEHIGYKTYKYPLIVADMTTSQSLRVVGISTDNDKIAKVKMPCGHEKTFNELPKKTIMCPCGNPNHIMWEIKN